jgi:hypothetical protein
VSPVTPPPRHAPEAARLYAADWQCFVAWCQAAGLAALPAAPATVAAFLAVTGKQRRGAGPPRGGIADHHRAAGFLSPPPPILR